jgi:predicted DCC family thiol-disulfide oxidoreductase YuxK
LQKVLLDEFPTFQDREGHTQSPLQRKRKANDNVKDQTRTLSEQNWFVNICDFFYPKVEGAYNEQRGENLMGDVPHDTHPIILFDSMCVLCSANAQFVLRFDKKRLFRLASMQGEVGAALYRRFDIDPLNPESLIIVSGDMLLRDSDAIFAIYHGLGWPWRAVGIFKFVPRPLRDSVYRWVARNRYRIFGRRDICWFPTPEYADRIL